MLEDEESSEEKVLDELMLFEEPSEGLPLQQGIERKGGEGYGSIHYCITSTQTCRLHCFKEEEDESIVKREWEIVIRLPMV